MTAVDIGLCADPDDPEWLGMRCALWPDDVSEHLEYMRDICAQPQRFATFLARRDGISIGFLEVSLRSDYVNGTTTSPVGFIEGIYVAPAERNRGIARELVAAAEHWARDRGCVEMGSDTRLDNVDGQALHRALGYEETGRVVYFVKPLQ